MKYRLISVIILVFAFFGTTNVQAQDSALKEAFVGSWISVFPDSVSVDSVNRLLLHIERTEDGSYTGTVDSPDQDIFDIPFSSVVVSGDSLMLKIETPYVQYSGELTDDALRIERTWETSNQSSRRFFEQFIENIGKNIPEQGFYERGIHTKTEHYGEMVQVFSTYESLRSPDAELFCARY